MLDDKRKFELSRLILRLMDGCINDDQLAELDEWLRQSPQSLAYYREFMHTQVGMSKVFCSMISDNDSAIAADSNISLEGVDINDVLAEDKEQTVSLDSNIMQAMRQLAECERTAPTVIVEKPVVKRELIRDVDNSNFKIFSGKVNKLSLCAAVFFAACLIGLLGFAYLTPTPIDPPVVAQLVDQIDAVWDEEMQLPDFDDHMKQNTYRLTAGYVSIKFNDGANVTIEAPAKWSLQSSGNMELFSGQIYAVVPERARGFSITAGNSKIIDRGTEFGIKVDKRNNTQLHVTKGRTLLFYGSKDGRKFEKEVDQGAARRVSSNGKLTIIPLASKKFARNIDSSSGQITRTSGFISYPQITNDADCGIDSSKTYTHAIDFGRNGVATINGVVFANDINKAAGGRSNAGSLTYGAMISEIAVSPTARQYGGLGTELNKLLKDFLWSGPEEGFIELTGLTPDQWYDVRLYNHAYDLVDSPRTCYFVYDVGSDGAVEFTTPKIDQNAPTLTPPGLSADVAHAMSYIYQADTSGKIKIHIHLADDAYGTYHLYGITNAETDPPDANTSTVNAGDDTATNIDGVQLINHKESK